MRDIRGDGNGNEGRGRMMGLPRYYVYHGEFIHSIHWVTVDVEVDDRVY